MIKNLLFSLVCLILAWPLTGQITEGDKTMSLGVNNSIMLEIPDSDVKVVEKVWKEYSRDFDKKTKKDRKSDEWVSNDPLLKGFKEVDVQTLRAKIEEAGSSTKITTWFELNGEYLSSYNYPQAFDDAQMVLMNFGIEVAKAYTMMELEAEEKSLKKLETTLNRLEREKSTQEKNIKDYEQRIVDAQNKIENNIVEQEATKQGIEDQKEVIELVRQKLAELDN